MLFRTDIEIPRWNPRIDYQEAIQLYGSCFVENIGSRMAAGRMNIDVNPTGIVYNPRSVADSIQRIASSFMMQQGDLVEREGLFHSMSHHSSFSGTDADEVLDGINQRILSSNRFFERSSWIIVTWGSAYVYEFSNRFPYDLSLSSSVVANCHKFPERMFDRRMLSVEEIVEDWTRLLENELHDKKVIVTVSPIRHLRDGFHPNQLSKSTLLLAANALTERFSNVCYFPSYEIMMDDLRDYRFYNADMVHPSELAIDYIWEKFSESCLSDSCRDSIKEWDQIRRGFEHRPRDPQSESYRSFIQKLERDKERFERKHGLLINRD